MMVIAIAEKASAAKPQRNILLHFAAGENASNVMNSLTKKYYLYIVHLSVKRFN